MLLKGISHSSPEVHQFKRSDRVSKFVDHLKEMVRRIELDNDSKDLKIRPLTEKTEPFDLSFDHLPTKKQNDS